MDSFVKNILILTADAGFGHRSAANALEEAICESYGENVKVDVYNPLDDKKAPLFLKESQTDYDKVVKNAPELYRLGYKASDASIPNALMESVLTILLFEVIRDTIKKFKPDVIISTYPMYLSPLDSVLSLQKKRIPVISVITDLASIHQIWFNKEIDISVVANDIVKQIAYKNGLKASQIEVTGIPVRPGISKIELSKAELRKKLGWEEDLPTILVVGSTRSGDPITHKLNLLNHTGFDFQLILVAGKDEVLYKQFNDVDWHVPVKIYDYVTEMPLFLAAADLNICKAGGLIVTESLASGLPMLLVDVIPGQEEGNARFVEENQAGFHIRSDADFLEKFYHFMIDGQKMLKTFQQNSKNLGKPYAAYDIAKLTWKYADFGLVENLQKPEKEKKIIGLLQNFHINLD